MFVLYIATCHARHKPKDCKKQQQNGVREAMWNQCRKVKSYPKNREKWIYMLIYIHVNIYMGHFTFTGLIGNLIIFFMNGTILKKSIELDPSSIGVWWNYICYTRFGTSEITSMRLCPFGTTIFIALLGVKIVCKTYTRCTPGQAKNIVRTVRKKLWTLELSQVIMLA